MDQNTGTRKSFLTGGLAVLALLVLVSCGAGLSGKYESDKGISLEFENNGKVLLGTTVFGLSNVVEVDYKIEGENLKLIPVQGQAAVVYKILPDGSIEGPMGVKLLKKK